MKLLDVCVDGLKQCWQKPALICWGSYGFVLQYLALEHWPQILWVLSAPGWGILRSGMFQHIPWIQI